MTTLSSYEDHDVIAATIRITGAGDGLSEALQVEPVELHHGDVVHVVLQCEVTKVIYEPVKDLDALRRVHVLRASFGTIVDEAFARAVLAEQRLVIERAQGVYRLPIDDGNGDTE